MSAAGVTQAELARAVGIKAPSISGWLSGKAKFLRGENLLRAAAKLNVSDAWLATGKGQRERLPGQASIPNAHVADYAMVEGDEDTQGAIAIPLTKARGSCGGGSVNDDEEQRKPIIKEAAWFRRYSVKPKDVMAIWADGDSNADFIVDGDIVFFNTSKREPRTGQFFLIEHPDGLRIKKLRRDIDGTWVLESNNPDKRAFPDEKITPDQAELLVIRGEFIYRQGG
jgi:phage repressor protein C with HTH and peptisase S24 domain